MFECESKPSTCAKHLIPSGMPAQPPRSLGTLFIQATSNSEGNPILLYHPALGSGRSIHADVLEPVRPTVFPVQPRLARSKLTGNTALALGRVGTVEEWNMLVADVTEPVDSVSDSYLQQGGKPRVTCQWILCLSSKVPSAILWTGASPHRS